MSADSSITTLTSPSLLLSSVWHWSNNEYPARRIYVTGDQPAFIIINNHGHRRSHSASWDAWLRHQRHRQTNNPSSPFIICNEHPHCLAFPPLSTAYLILLIQSWSMKGLAHKVRYLPFLATQTAWQLCFAFEIYLMPSSHVNNNCSSDRGGSVESARDCLICSTMQLGLPHVLQHCTQ